MKTIFKNPKLVSLSSDEPDKITVNAHQLVFRALQRARKSNKSGAQPMGARNEGLSNSFSRAESGAQLVPALLCE